MNNWVYVLIALVVLELLTIPLCIWANHKQEYTPVCIEDTWQFILSIIIWVVGGLALLFTTLALIIGVPSAKEEYHKYKNKYDYVMQVIENRSDLENFGITETILEYNEWLESAKARKEVYGNWSFYRDIDLESMKYLGVEKRE